MTNHRLPEIIITTYQDFYRSITFDSKYTLPANDQNITLIDNFIHYLGQRYKGAQIGHHFVVDFMEISFAWWYKHKKLKYGMQSIKLAWIIGKKSVDRFNTISQDPEKMAYFSTVFAADVKHGIRAKVGKISSNYDKAVKSILDDLNPIEEKQKLKLYNTLEGLFWCASNTTLYNPKSKLCHECLNKVACKKLLKENLPKLYRLRNGEDDEKPRVTGRFFT